MRFLKVWYILTEDSLILKEGCLGKGLFVESLQHALQLHFNVEHLQVKNTEEWGLLSEPKKYLILDTRFRQIVTEEYLGEWDEIYEL